MKIVNVKATYRTSQSAMNTPSGKNIVGHEFMNRPQICSPECEFLLLVRVISFNSIPQLFQLVDQGSQHHIDFGLGWSGPGTMRQRNINSYFMQREEGRLYGTTNMGQQEYDDALSPKGVKPSVASPIQTFIMYRANSRSKLSKAFHASESEGCTITSLFSLSPYLCHRI
jgi:hypothetical protein